MASLSESIKAKSDQLNADDLVGGAIVVRVERVNVTTGEQPVVVHISGGFRPWKPCKTERRVLVFAWGEEGDNYVGRTLELVRDENVTWAGAKVGGVRIQRMSHILRPVEVSLAVSKGKKAMRRIGILPVEGADAARLTVDIFRPTLIAATKREVDPWTLTQIKEWLLGNRKAEDIPSFERDEILQRLAGPPCEPPKPEDDGYDV